MGNDENNVNNLLHSYVVNKFVKSQIENEANKPANAYVGNLDRNMYTAPQPVANDDDEPKLSFDKTALSSH